MPIEQPAPYVLAMLICDSVYIDPSTGKKTLLGLFSAIFSREFPAVIPPIFLYAALTDGRGMTTVQVKVVDSDDEREPVFQGEQQVDFSDPRVVVELLMVMMGLSFPEPGEYRLQLWACNSLLMERRIVVSEAPK